jgi:hypothetical protein
MAEVRVDGSASGLLEFNELSFFYFLDKFLLPVPFFFWELSFFINQAASLQSFSRQGCKKLGGLY